MIKIQSEFCHYFLQGKKLISAGLRSFAFVAATLLFSSQTYALTPEEQASYQEAKKLYAAKAYGDSYALLSSLYLNALDNAELNFYLGRAAFESGDFSMALAAFERVAMLEPDNVRNSLELARTQYYVHLFAEAEGGFKKIHQNPGLPENVRLNVEYYLSSIAKQQQRSYIFTTARAGILYDSNVNFGSIDDTFTLPGLGIFSSSKPIRDIAHEEAASLTHLYDFGARGGWIMRNGISIYNRSYSDEHDYNLVLFSYSPALVYNDKRSSYEFIGGINHLCLGGKSYYSSYSIQPKWTYSYLPSLRQSLAFSIGRKDYSRTIDEGMDSRSLEAEAALEYYLSASSSLQAQLVASRQIKNGGDRIDVNYVDISPSLLYTNQLLPRTILQANASLKSRKYDDYSDLFQSYRTDKTVYGSINLIQRLTNDISLEFMANYNHTDSTLSVYSFDKYMLSMSLSTRF